MIKRYKFILYISFYNHHIIRLTCFILWPSPFGSRSPFDRFPFDLRFSFVSGSFQLRSDIVSEARSIEQVTEME